MKWILIGMSCCFLACSSSFPDKSVGGHDEQFLQIFFHHGMCNELDTFQGTYQKDLVSKGTAKTTLWLTKKDQDTILAALEKYHFFNLPDTIPKEKNASVSPDMGLQVLKVKYGDKIKTVVWHELSDPKYHNEKYSIEVIKKILINIIYSTPEYKAMPEAEGLYL